MHMCTLGLERVVEQSLLGCRIMQFANAFISYILFLFLAGLQNMKIIIISPFDK